jgi:putative lipoic acid-binding regulatory protein
LGPYPKEWIQNVLFVCNIHVTEDYWHNYSPFTTNVFGQVTITREEIITDIINTGANQEENMLLSVPTYFELHVWGGQFTVDLVQRVRQLLQQYTDENGIRQYLKEQKILEENIPLAIEIIKNKATEDNAFYERIESAVNNYISVSIAGLSTHRFSIA